MADIDLSVAVCTWNRADIIKECILYAHNSCQRIERGWEILIVDNGSTDSTWSIVQDLCRLDGVRAIREEHPGLSHARNSAVAHSRGKVIVFIDDDVLVPVEYVRTVIEAFESSGADIVGGPLLPKWESRLPFWMGEGLYGILGLLNGRQNVEGTAYPRIFGANMAFRRETLKMLGDAPFEPLLGRTGNQLLGNEESYLIRCLTERGAKVEFSERALAYHRVARKRLRVAYFIRWHFFWGISDCREAAIKSGKRGLPRWVVGEMLRRGIEVPWYFLTFRPGQAVRSLFRFAGRLGRVWEHVRTCFTWQPG